MATAWKSLEDEVRKIAETIWGVPFQSCVVHGRQIDAYAEIDSGHSIAIEVTTEKNVAKIQGDLNKLIHVQGANFLQHRRMTDCFCVTSYVPTTAMINVCASQNMVIESADQFRTRFLPFKEYYESRSSKPFGSAVDPQTGLKDQKDYVVVQFLNEDGSVFGDIRRLQERIQSSKKAVLIGEYGTGKSKSFERLFELLAQEAWETYRFPVAIDLRRCWGLKNKYEIIRRHFDDLGLSKNADAFIKAYNDGFLLLLIDGFDEMAVQAWSDDSNAMKNLRAEALAGVRELIAGQSSGMVICGRDHYFDSHEELISALGLGQNEPLVVKSNDEFTYEEITEFIRRVSDTVVVPEWLPRKPLTCEFYVELVKSNSIEDEDVLDAIRFWDIYLGAVCERESKIHPSFDSETIKKILIAVAAVTRTKSDGVGPLTLKEIQQAFEKVVGYSPIEQAGVLLQRLAGLGRTAADTEDRRFTDTYLLEGLRAMHVIGLVEVHDSSAMDVEWMNPLSENSLLIAARKLQTFNLSDEAIGFCKKFCRQRNKTLIFDLVNASVIVVIPEIDFGGVEIDGGYGATLDLSKTRVAGLFISNSVLEKIILSGMESPNLRITSTDIGVAQGVSSAAGIPEYLKGNKIESFTSIATVSRIKTSDISAEHKVLVTILRKTYFQKGAARKEEALLRGLGKLVKSNTLDKIINKLIGEHLLTKAKGEEGTIYAPVRSETSRVSRMLAELGLSKDPIWLFADSV